MPAALGLRGPPDEAPSLVEADRFDADAGLPRSSPNCHQLHAILRGL